MQENKKNRRKSGDALRDAAAMAVAQQPTQEQKEQAAVQPSGEGGQLDAIESYMREWDAPSIKKVAIGPEELHEAMERLKRYQMGKAAVDARIVENEQWWRMRHWEYVRTKEGQKEKERLEPTTAWLLNSIMNKHADAMDSYPEAIVLPREKNDQ